MYNGFLIKFNSSMRGIGHLDLELRSDRKNFNNIEERNQNSEASAVFIMPTNPTAWMHQVETCLRPAQTQS
jgi:hypothetical protein